MLKKNRTKGFTLIEMLLVLVIVSILVYLSVGYMQQRALQMRYDRTSAQMQQILNAGLSFYVFNGRWPNDMNELTPNYLPVGMKNPWGNDYKIAVSPQLMHVFTRINVVGSSGAYAAATFIAGSLPLSYISTDPGNVTSPNSDPPNPADTCTAANTTCYVVAAVNIPGQNLNNAAAINFAGLYHHGACVPVPTCPADPKEGNTMEPQIFVVPVQVAGTKDGDKPAANPNVYPISSFTAYATGKEKKPQDPPACASGGAATPCSGGSGFPGDQFWRVCMQVVTEKGEIKSTDTGWGQHQVVAAFTRCSIQNEPKGSAFNVFTD